MSDPRLNDLLKWGITNSEASRNDANTTNPAKPLSQSDIQALQELISGMSGPSDAQLMKQCMDVIDDDDADLESKLTAFDNFEQLIENLDNANNMENLQLWTRLVKHLDSEVADLRMYAAWCCAIAVQNNISTQERLLLVGAIPTLVRLATEGDELKVKKKAILALSSAVRNFQPGLDATVSCLPPGYELGAKLDADDMASVDVIINKMREQLP